MCGETKCRKLVEMTTVTWHDITFIVVVAMRFDRQIRSREVEIIFKSHTNVIGGILRTLKVCLDFSGHRNFQKY